MGTLLNGGLMFKNNTIWKKTFDVRVPLDIEKTYTRFPFNVVRADLVVELDSFAIDESEVLIRPDLMLNKENNHGHTRIHCSATNIDNEKKKLPKSLHN